MRPVAQRDAAAEKKEGAVRARRSLRLGCNEAGIKKEKRGGETVRLLQVRMGEDGNMNVRLASMAGQRSGCATDIIRPGSCPWRFVSSGSWMLLVVSL
jgi:hypothetical protein